MNASPEPLCEWQRNEAAFPLQAAGVQIQRVARPHQHWRAWKEFDWDALDRLYEKGLIGDPVNKAKSVVFTEEGLRRAEELFRAMFPKPD